MLRVDNLSVAFRRYRGLFRQVETPALSGVDFAINANEVVGVIGSSGAGKSLLAHAILGLLPSNAVLCGDVTFHRGPVADHLGRRISFVPQQIGHLDPLARVGRQLAWAGKQNCDPAIARLYPHQISGGMARGVMMDIAMARDPELLIADEPTAGLDPTLRDDLLARLRTHADRGGAVLLITHDLIAALPVCNRVVLIDDGRMRGIERTDAFHGAGAALSPHARALWCALPQNGFHA